jgi:hypothetical protein
MPSHIRIVALGLLALSCLNFSLIHGFLAKRGGREVVYCKNSSFRSVAFSTLKKYLSYSIHRPRLSQHTSSSRWAARTCFYDGRGDCTISAHRFCIGPRMVLSRHLIRGIRPSRTPRPPFYCHHVPSDALLAHAEPCIRSFQLRSARAHKSLPWIPSSDGTVRLRSNTRASRMGESRFQI